MYNVRLAVPEDFHEVLPMARKFYGSTSFAASMDFDVASVLEFYIHMLQTGFVIVAENEEGLVGMLGAIVHPFHLNTNFIVCTETMWWVELEHRRSSVGKDMLDLLEKLAADSGCKTSVLSKLDTSPESLGQYYESRGYHATEASYVKEL